MTKMYIPYMPMLISDVLEVCVVSNMVREDRGHGLILAVVTMSLSNAATCNAPTQETVVGTA
jgi:hypothetical protein